MNRRMTKLPVGGAANEVYRLPPPLFDARCRACWFAAAALALIVASFWSLDLQWARFFAPDAFILLEQRGKRTLVLSDLEIDRGRKARGAAGPRGPAAGDRRAVRA